MLETKRLQLRQWKDSDIEPYCQINASEQVMRYFPSVDDKGREQSSSRPCTQLH
ncbi:GNAT family N-acetyltransferase [Vibrio tubiashii]|uniref:Acetyltransferase n=1 Tax=Vibrio tubiashii ATCC 19109 TaxID=1051646 RepID=A0ABN0DL47_9VIBR|nr:GNAT family N-acetyltransferase [Vibrio tubiashii]EGU58680.1 hypothetical protein VITU9109_22586 [Vibrio tubiashii ATCC 19109]